MWIAVYGLAAVSLAIYFKGMNAVWGAATLGLVVGIIFALVLPGFSALTIARSVSIATIAGAVLESVYRMCRVRPVERG